jgi:hypothetical protein
VARRTRGFWTGLTVGVLLGAAAAALLAVIYPLATTPPAIDDATLAAPGAPPSPRAATPGERPRPVIEARPATDVPALPGVAVPALDPFEGAATGSPSLFPGGDGDR